MAPPPCPASPQGGRKEGGSTPRLRRSLCLKLRHLATTSLDRTGSHTATAERLSADREERREAMRSMIGRCYGRRATVAQKPRSPKIVRVRASGGGFPQAGRRLVGALSVKS
jgi:hypothetical protein